MKKNFKNKGFTLIELLAVILILGIIALIAIPIVSGVIVDSKKGAFKTGVQNIVKAIEQQCQKEKINGKGHTKLYTFSENGVSPQIDIKGELPISGLLTVNDKCQVSFRNVSNGEIIASKTIKGDIILSKGEETQSHLPEGLTKGTVVYINPSTASVCSDYVERNSMTGIKTGCFKWYVYKDNEDGTYQLILDHNTSERVAWNSNAYIAVANEVTIALANDTASWDNQLNARLIRLDEVLGIIELETENLNLGSSNEELSKYSWIYDRTGSHCKNYGCPNNATFSGYSDYTRGYWMETLSDEYNCGLGGYCYAYSISYAGYIDKINTNYNQFIGVRPVITF